MSISQLASDAVANLAPFLPFIHDATSGAAKKLGEKTTEAGLEYASRIWAWLHARSSSVPDMQAAALDVAQNPDEADLQAVLRVQIRKLLESQPKLEQELQAIVDSKPQQFNSVTASGDGAIAIGGNAVGNIMTTRAK